MQEKLRAQLHRKHGRDAVMLEKDYIDARVDTTKETILYEIKTDATPREAIRTAIGQLLEYAYYHSEAPSRVPRLVVVGRSKIDQSDDAYLRSLKRKFRLRLEYLQITV